jgi:hypothetical protein
LKTKLGFLASSILSKSVKTFSTEGFFFLTTRQLGINIPKPASTFFMNGKKVLLFQGTFIITN